MDGDGPIGDRSLKNEVYAQIVARIHSGELRPGDRINETDIAQRLGISRAPVREAFTQLAYEGLIERKPRTGNFITRLDQSDLEDIRDARILLECHAARMACRRITEREADVLARLIVELHAAAQEGKWTEAAMLNSRFHQTVVQFAGSRTLARLWKTLDPLAWLLAPAASPRSSHSPENLVTRHQALLDALLTRDPDQAAAVFRAHVIEGAMRTARLGPDSAVEGIVEDGVEHHAGVPGK